MSRRWSVEPDVEDELRALLAVGETPTKALDRLSRDPTYSERLPSLRTAERMASEIRPAKTDRWSFATASPEEARHVLPVLGIWGESYGSLSLETAAWIVRVSTAAPGLSPRDVFLWAIRYQAATTAGRNTAALDTRLAREVTG